MDGYRHGEAGGRRSLPGERGQAPVNKFYLIYGGALIGLLSLIHIIGWSPTSTQGVKGVPTSVRDNPGVYRTHYIYGGK